MCKWCGTSFGMSACRTVYEKNCPRKISFANSHARGDFDQKMKSSRFSISKTNGPKVLKLNHYSLFQTPRNCTQFKRIENQRAFLFRREICLVFIHASVSKRWYCDRWVRPDSEKLRRIVVRVDPLEKDLASLRSGPVAMAATKTTRSCTVLSLLHQLQFIFRA